MGMRLPCWNACSVANPFVPREINRGRLSARIERSAMPMTDKIKSPSPEFLAKLEQKLTQYRDAGRSCSPKRCRLLQYTGADKPNGSDISPEHIEDEISFGLAEGLIVDWLCEDSVLYICTQEPDCPLPSWDTVKAEEAMIDVDTLLRDAGFEV